MNDLVLAIHPASRGFGWILFESRHVPFDWGTMHITKDRNATALLRINALLNKYQPRFVVLESFEAPHSLRRSRTRHLCRSILRTADKQGIAVHCIPRERVKARLSVGTRKDAAVAVANLIEPLKPRLPKPRHIWVGESLNMALFSAAACAVTFYAEQYPD